MTQIPPPLGGISDHFSYEKQPPSTSSDAKNVRAIDSATNRIRLSQRGGHVRVSDSRLSGSGKVQAITSVTHDGRQTTFTDSITAAAGDLTDWARRLSQSEPCNGVKVDFQGNIYALNGNASLSKYNSAGVLLWDFSFPVKSPSHIVRVLDVDDVGQIYVAVSEGTSNQNGAWIRCYVDDADRNLVKLWEVLPRGFTTQVRIENNKLFAVVNMPDRNKAEIQVYESISSFEPSLERTKNVPFPANDLDVKDNGDAFTASGPFTNRSYDPRSPTTTAIIDEPRWAPVDLDQFKDRIHCWMSGETIEKQPGWADIQENDDVTEWRDMLGKGNVVFTYSSDLTSGGITVTNMVAPKYVKTGLGGRPAIRFHDENCRLATQGSLGASENLADSQPIVCPSEVGFSMFMVLKISEDATPTNGTSIFHQHSDNGSFVLEAIGILGNGHLTATPSITFTAGEVSLWADNDGTAPAADETIPRLAIGEFTNNANAVIVSLIYDSKDGVGESYFRVNGVPLAKFKGEELRTPQGVHSVLGRFINSGLDFESPLFEISELLVIKRYTDSNDAKQLIEVPDHNTLASGGAGSEGTLTPLSDTECERIEGYLAWRYGLAHLLDHGDVDAATSPTFDADGGHSQFAHPFVLDTTANAGSPPNPDGRNADTIDSTLWLSPDGIVAKWNAQRNAVRWAFTGGGVGYAVRLDSAGNLYNVGPRKFAVPAENYTIRKLLDRGASVSGSWQYAISNGGGSYLDYAYEYPRIAMDEFDNMWIPYNYADAGVADLSQSLLAFTKTQPPTGAVPFFQYQIAATDNQSARAVAVDPRTPDYSNQATALTRPEHIVLGTDEGLALNANKSVLHSIHVIDATANNAAPRITNWIGVAGGDIVKFTGGVVTTIQVGALASTATIVSAVSAFSKVYMADGVSYKIYDPKKDTVVDWESDTEGAIPDRCALLTFWRGRMVLARGTGDPQNWHMSAVGNPHDFNQFPPDGPLPTQAISGNNSDVGTVPDIINALIPYDRDRLIFGCDHSIHMLWSDPMVDGRLVLLSDITGIALGTGWTKDSAGVLYFYGSRGGIFAMMPGGESDLVTKQPDKISSQSIDKRVGQIDLATHTIQMAWDDADQTLHVYQVPYGAGGTIVTHWAWEKKTGSWWEDTFADASIQPTCVTVLDGDDVDDRVVAIGCEDGFVRRPSQTATSDDGWPIDGYVTIGPWYDASGQVRLRNPKIILARDQGGCHLEMFSGDTPDVLGEPVAAVRLGPGQNPTQMIGVRGAYAWLRLRNSAAGQRWAFESGQIQFLPAGRKVAP